jgi:hypothetical protein
LKDENRLTVWLRRPRPRPSVQARHIVKRYIVRGSCDFEHLRTMKRFTISTPEIEPPPAPTVPTVHQRGEAELVL